MIREFQRNDINKVADIWLDTNIKAHNFIPAEYWKSNFKSVKEALLLAEVYVYENESQKIKNILKDILVEVYHIGSTAVKGLAAKSIIDIMPVVTNISLVDKHNKEFVAIGYECMGEFGIEGRRYFRKGGDNRTHQIHIFEQSNHKDINRHIAVRDFLRTHPDIALEYGELKMELAYRFSEDIEGYCTGKDAFVKQLEKDALLWYQNNESYKTR